MDLRAKAVELVGVEKESEIFKITDESNYAYVVRRVMSGMSVKEAMSTKQVHRVSKTYEVAEGETTCPRCGSKRIIKDELQTRSADESKTVFCECSKCGKRFKF